MEVNQSTFGDRNHNQNDTIVEDVKPIVETVEVPPTTVVTEEGKVENVVVDKPIVEKKEPEVVDENSSNFNIDLEDKPKEQVAQQAAEQQAQIDWKEQLKKLDPKEVLKEIGISDFALEMDAYIKSGNNPADYLGAKAIDYTKISHQDLVMAELKSQYPTISDEKLQKIFEKKYSQDLVSDDEDKEIGLIQLEADAENIRANKIANQAKFVIPETPQNNVEQQLQERIKQLQEQNQQEYNKSLEFFNNNEATKQLLESKRVAAKYGEDGVFNFNIDKPELLMKVITDGSIWSKVTSTKEGVPDVGKLQEIALFALDPVKFKTDFVNLGKALGAKSLIDEGKNATRQAGSMPKDAHQEAAVYKTGTYGSRSKN